MRFNSAAFAVVLASASTDAFHVSPSRVAISSRPSQSAPAFGVLPQQQQQQQQQQRQSRQSTALYFAPDPPQKSNGVQRLEAFIEASNLKSKTSKLKNPKLAKLAGVAALPLSYIVGAAITPTRYLAAKAVAGAVAVASAGAVSKSAVEEDVRKSCLPAIASRLIELGIDGPNTADGIDALKSDYGVEDSDFLEMKLEVYAQYFIGMAQNPNTKTSELKELMQLREALRLDNAEVGHGRAIAASLLCAEIQSQNDYRDLEYKFHPDNLTIDKFLWLTERSLVQGGESEEAKTFEFSRVVNLLDVYPPTAMQRAKEVAYPFYERALKSTRDKLESGAVSSEMLEKARKTLGISDEDATRMSIAAFDEEVRAQLGISDEYADNEGYDDIGDEEYDQFRRVATDSEGRELLEQLQKEKKEWEEGIIKSVKVEETTEMKFKEGAFEHLSKLQAILGLDDKDAQVVIESYTADYFEVTAIVAFRDVTSGIITPAKCWDILKARADELLLKDSTVKTTALNLILNTLAQSMNKVASFARVSNAAATYDGLVDALAAKEICKAVCQAAGWEKLSTNFEQIIFNPDNKQSVCGSLSKADRKKMYDLFFSRTIKLDDNGRRKIDDEAREMLKGVGGMLGVSEEVANDQFKSVFGPELTNILVKATEEIMAGDVTPTLLENMSNDVKQVIEDFGLDEEMKQQSALPLYEQSVRKIATTTPGGIPSKDEVKTLESLRSFLGIDEEELTTIHINYFGQAYKKAVKEALGTTGVIREEFRAPLEDLRSRLGVPDDASKKFFIEAIGERMQPMVEYIAEEMERTVMSNAQLAQKRGADYGEDLFKSGKAPEGKLGLGTEGNIMGDIMNLVDFYVENGMITKEAVGTKKVEKKITEDGEEKTVEEEVPVYENSYPITALGKRWMDEQTAELCYRQFLVSSFTEQGPEVARYDANKATFGGILGLSAEKMEDIGSNIGGMVYDNYVTQALSSKDALDQQDMMFLANMQGKLGLSAEQGEELLLNTQKKIVSEEASALFNRGGKGPATPEEIKAFREKCNSMGLDLEADVGLSRARIVNMFSMEISPGIDSGEITMDSGDLIAEIQESLGLTEEEGEEIISNLITERAAMLYVAIRSCLLRGFDAAGVDEINKLIQYARFVDGELGLEVAERDANHAIGVYENSDLSALDDATKEERITLLKKALGQWKEEEEVEAEDSEDAPVAEAESDSD